MVSKSQEELEQPAKVYQLNAVENKVDQALKKLDDIASSVSGVITNTQLEGRLKEFEVEQDIKLAELEKRIHLKYEPSYKGVWWVVGAIAAGLLAMAVASIWGPK